MIIKHLHANHSYYHTNKYPFYTTTTILYLYISLSFVLFPSPFLSLISLLLRVDGSLMVTTVRIGISFSPVMKRSVNLSTMLCMCVCMYFIYIYIYWMVIKPKHANYSHIYVCMYVQLYICMYVCIYTHIYYRLNDCQLGSEAALSLARDLSHCQNLECLW